MRAGHWSSGVQASAMQKSAASNLVRVLMAATLGPNVAYAQQSVTARYALGMDGSYAPAFVARHEADAGLLVRNCVGSIRANRYSSPEAGA